MTGEADTAAILTTLEVGTVGTGPDNNATTNRSHTLIDHLGTADEVASLNIEEYKVGTVNLRLPLPPTWHTTRLHYHTTPGYHNSRTLSKHWLKKILEGMRTCAMKVQPIHLHFPNTDDRPELNKMVKAAKVQDDITYPWKPATIQAHKVTHVALMKAVLNPTLKDGLPASQSPVVPMIGQHTLKAVQDMSVELYDWMRVQKKAKDTIYTPSESNFPFEDVLKQIRAISKDKTAYAACPPHIKSILNFFNTNPQLPCTILCGLPDKARLALVTLTNQNYVGFPNTFQTWLYDARCYLMSLLPSMFTHRSSMTRPSLCSLSSPSIPGYPSSFIFHSSSLDESPVLFFPLLPPPHCYPLGFRFCVLSPLYTIPLEPLHISTTFKVNSSSVDESTLFFSLPFFPLDTCCLHRIQRTGCDCC